jgi:hypothetical protein
MKPSAVALLALVALAGCGSEDSPSSPTLSSPLPPVTTPLDGSYDLVLTPAETCRLPGAPYVVRVEVRSLEGTGGEELRATLPGGDGTLVLEMLYAEPGALEGSVSTLDWVAAGASWLFVRASGSGRVTAAAGGRAEVESGTMTGDVQVVGSGGGVLTCTNADHRWALLAR